MEFMIGAGEDRGDTTNAQGQEPGIVAVMGRGAHAVISIACMFDKLPHCGTRETVPIEIRVGTVMRYQP